MNKQITRTIGSGISVLTFTDFFINVDLTNGSATIILPKISDFLNYLSNGSGTYIQNQSYRFKDIKNLAAINNITIISATGDKISNSSSQVFNTNGVSFSLQITSDTDWDISSSSNVTANGGGVPLGYHNQSSSFFISSNGLINHGVLFIVISPCFGFPVQIHEITDPIIFQSGANTLLFNGTGGTLKRCFFRFYENEFDKDVTFTLRKNGQDTAITFDVAAGQVGDFSDTINSIDFNGTTDEFCYSVKPKVFGDPPSAGLSLKINMHQIWMYGK